MLIMPITYVLAVFSPVRFRFFCSQAIGTGIHDHARFHDVQAP